MINKGQESIRKAFLCKEDTERKIIIQSVVDEATKDKDLSEEEKDLIVEFLSFSINYIVETMTPSMRTESYLATFITVARNIRIIDNVDPTLLFERVSDDIVLKTLDVLKWDVTNNCDDDYERNLTLNNIPDLAKVGKEPRRQWRVLMNNVMEMSSTQEREVYLRLRLNIYEKEKQTLTNKSKICNLICGIYYYLINGRPLVERTYENVIKLLGAAKTMEKQIRSPFTRIIEQEYRANSMNYEYRHIKENLYSINNTDVDDALEFMRWDVMKKDPIDKDEILGYISMMQAFMYKNVMIEHDDEYAAKGETTTLDAETEHLYTIFEENYKPETIKGHLDQYIIGQDSAKKNVSSAVYNHIQRCLHPEMHLNKSNVLLIGPSGCGKTEIIRRLKEMFAEEGINIPIVISDFSGVVATPWKGRNKEEILARLFDEADKDIERAQRGIVFLDEFDKIIPSVAGGARGYDYNNELQGQMLGMLEGTSCQVKVQIKEGNREVDANILMRTDNILFILAGAFDGLDEIIRKNERANMTSTFGMVSNKKEHIDFDDENVTIDNLMGFGLRAELAGRIGYVSVLKPLLKDDMIRILKEAKDNIITKYQNAMFAEDGITLEFEDDAYSALADKVQEFNIGARGLNAILHDVLADVMFKAPSIPGIEKVIITGDKVNGKGDAIYITNQNGDL